MGQLQWNLDGSAHGLSERRSLASTAVIPLHTACRSRRREPCTCTRQQKALLACTRRADLAGENRWGGHTCRQTGCGNSGGGWGEGVRAGGASTQVSNMRIGSPAITTCLSYRDGRSAGLWHLICGASTLWFLVAAKIQRRGDTGHVVVCSVHAGSPA